LANLTGKLYLLKKYSSCRRYSLPSLSSFTSPSAFSLQPVVPAVASIASIASVASVASVHSLLVFIPAPGFRLLTPHFHCLYRCSMLVILLKKFYDQN
jgi:hypothetical protein